MTTGVLPETGRHCPYCGRDMTTIEVDIATPPFVVELVGCETCGITTNELAAAEPAAAPDGRGGE